jgi:threonine dehydratase
MQLPSKAGVIGAAKLLAGRVVQTPVLESRLLNAELGGGRLLLKAENLQHTGSFKYRGALHRLLCLQRDDPSAAARGVVAFSSGNFGQALAAAATTLKLNCTIVSPHDAPPVKLERIQKYGATLQMSTANYDKGENREVIAAQMAHDISHKHGMTLLHPFDDIEVIHGQGTIAHEFVQQVRDLEDAGNSPNGSLDLIAVPAGGGGMAAGICLYVEDSDTKVVTVEPTGYDDHVHSFAHSEKDRRTLAEIYSENDDVNSIEKSVYCDALMAGSPGSITWDVNRNRLADAIAISSDKSVARAMRVAFDHFRLVLEPSGALSLAAVLDRHLSSRDPSQPILPPGMMIGVIASGGNTDLTTYAKLMGCKA